jgi:flagellar protein FliJ
MSSHSEFGPGLTKDSHLSMPSPGRLIRLKESHANETQRLAAQIEVMIADFDRMANDLEREIQAEQDRAGIRDPAHYAYPTYAKAAVARRDNLKRSVQDLKVQLANVKMPSGLHQRVN